MAKPIIEFKAGDRVSLTRLSYPGFKRGDTGTVMGLWSQTDYEGNVKVDWDNGVTDPGFYYTDLRLADPKQKPSEVRKEILDYYSAVTGE